MQVVKYCILFKGYINSCKSKTLTPPLYTKLLPSHNVPYLAYKLFGKSDLPFGLFFSCEYFKVNSQKWKYNEIRVLE